MANDSVFSINLNEAERMLSTYQELARLTSEIVSLSKNSSELARNVFKQGSLQKHIVDNLSLYDVKLADYAATANVMQLFVADAMKTYIDMDKLIAKSILDSLMSDPSTDQGLKNSISSEPDTYSQAVYDYVKEENAGENNG